MIEYQETLRNSGKSWIDDVSTPKKTPEQIAAHNRRAQQRRAQLPKRPPTM